MTAILENPAVRELVLPFSVEKYHELSESGIVPEKTELLRGYVIEKMTKSPLHTWLVQRLFDWFHGQVEPHAYVRKEEPLTLAVSEPEPDVAVVDGGPDDYQTAHPHTARLVIEVAVSSEDVDRVKGEDYAGAGVREYWIVLAEKNTVEVYRDPSATGYRDKQIYSFGDTIPLADFGSLAFPVDHLRQSAAN